LKSSSFFCCSCVHPSLTSSNGEGCAIASSTSRIRYMMMMMITMTMKMIMMMMILLLLLCRLLLLSVHSRINFLPSILQVYYFCSYLIIGSFIVHPNVNPRQLNTYFESVSDNNNHDDLIMILLVIIMIMICQS